MSRMPSVLISALDNYGGHPFDHIFDAIIAGYGAQDVIIGRDLSDRCALVIWGGADISPVIYNQRPNKYTDAGSVMSRRDELEVEMAEKAIELGIPIIGICRGAQLMCALSGGSLVQHVDGHTGGYHKIVTQEGNEYNCPSLHHQMMFPWPRGDSPPMEFDMIAWMAQPKGTAYYGEPLEDDEEKCELLVLQGPEPEIIWIPGTKSLCIQSHPEFIHDVNHPFVQYTLELTKRYCLPEPKDVSQN